MNLTAFQSQDGDCLLVTGSDGKTILVDGGRPESYHKFVAPVLAQMGHAGHALDLVCVSHIDSDHIGGIKAMIGDLVKWHAFDYQQSRGNSHFRPPDAPRPPEIRGLWHNSFKGLVGANTSAIHSQILNNNNTLLSLTSFANEIEQNAGLATSIRESLELSGLAGPEALRIPLNKPFRAAVTAPDLPRCLNFGSMSLYVLGPQKADLKKLEKDWNKWLKNNQKAVEDVRKGLEKEINQLGLPLPEGEMVMSFVRELATTLGQRNLVTPPNLASILLMVEENGKTILLTGDGHSDDVMKGLAAQNLLVNGGLQVDVLKVPHHGSENNITQDFCQKVTAAHYVFCSNGAHDNPDLRVLRMLATERLKAPGNFTFWFTSNSNITDTRFVPFMRQVEEVSAQLVTESGGRLTTRFLQNEPLIQIAF